MKRWWGIRHVRYFYLTWQAIRWAQMWGQIGVGLGHVNEGDLRYLDAVWRGER